MKPLRYMLGLGLALLAWVAGCGVIRGFGGSPAYGVAYYPAYGVEPPAHDPSVLLQDFSYTPASPWQIGTEFTVRAVLNHALVPADAALIRCSFGPQLEVSLHDNGVAPDATALDGIWTGGWGVTHVVPPGENLPVTLSLEWADGWPGQQLDGPPLTVLPEEDGGQ